MLISREYRVVLFLRGTRINKTAFDRANLCELTIFQRDSCSSRRFSMSWWDLDVQILRAKAFGGTETALTKLLEMVGKIYRKPVVKTAGFSRSIVSSTNPVKTCDFLQRWTRLLTERAVAEGTRGWSKCTTFQPPLGDGDSYISHRLIIDWP